ncbi:MAG: hypothetical protein NXH75_15070, partial [Halobacteriovoraceae bacterium]|nr:hypothetical protein [Halobacteriovoraceae bacterium]
WRGIQDVPRILQSLGGIPFCLFDENKWRIKGLREDSLFQGLIDFGKEKNLGLRPLSYLMREREKKSDLDGQEYSVSPLLR